MGEQLPKVLEYTSFKWMKEHQDKFEVHTLLPFPLLQEGAMVRKGKAGCATEDGMTPEIAADIKAWAEKMVPDPAARKWMYEGGPIDKPSGRGDCFSYCCSMRKVIALRVYRFVS